MVYSILNDGEILVNHGAYYYSPGPSLSFYNGLYTFMLFLWKISLILLIGICIYAIINTIYTKYQKHKFEINLIKERLTILEEQISALNITSDISDCKNEDDNMQDSEYIKDDVYIVNLDGIIEEEKTEE